MSHFVYFLFRAGTNELLYIGRSNRPERRKWAFEKRTGLATEFGCFLRFSDFGNACAAELRCIAEMSPRFNVKMISSAGRVGATTGPEYRARISATLKGRASPMLGKKHSEETRAKMSHALTGRAGTMTGRKFTEEHRAKIGASNRERAAEKKRKYEAACAASR